MPSSTEDITELLAALRNGDFSAENRLAPLVYAELHQIAERFMRRERKDHTLQPTVLVNEAFMRLVRHDHKLQNRKHFYAMAANVMRHLLVDYARQHRTHKRGGDLQRVDLDNLLLSSDYSEKLLALDEALSRLSKWDPRQSRVVELRFFAGLTEEEIADVLGMSPRSVKRDWTHAKAWLYLQIGK
jgi:RNA polymerase sigma-70 factor, ECF subfamily